MMWKKFTEQGNQKWFKILPDIIDKYNNNVHRSIGITPTDACENPTKIKQSSEQSPLIKTKPKFKVGERVRIYKYKHHFEKGFTAKWTEEIFIISKIFNTNPITYGIIDENGEKILGRFYPSELQKTDF